MYKSYYDDNSIQAKINLKNGLKNGSCILYYKNGNIQTKLWFKNDTPVDQHVYFNEDGGVLKIEDYEYEKINK